VQVLLELHAEFLHHIGHLFTHVQAVGELAAEHRDHPPLAIALDGVLAAQRRPLDGVGVAGSALDDQGTDAASLGDDVGGGERLGQVEPGVDLRQQELAVLVGDVGDGLVDSGVGGADDRAAAHWNDIEQPLRVVEEREHTVVLGGGEARHHEVDAFRVDDAVVGGGAPPLVQGIDERPGRIDDDSCRGGVRGPAVGVAQFGLPLVAVTLGAHQFDVVGG
jgi:hypothetical protein